MEYKFIQKIPLNPPLLKGENIKKDFGMTDNKHVKNDNCFATFRLS